MQSKRRRHRAEIRADIDHIGDDQQAHQRIKKPRSSNGAACWRRGPAGHPADIGADHLDRAHQRIGEKQRPDQAVAELRAGLRIGGDAAGVVVGSAGDEARTEDVGKPRPVRLLNLIGSRMIDRGQSQAPRFYREHRQLYFVPYAFASARASMTARAHSSGRSCGRLWPAPLNMRCSCGPVNFFA